MIRFYLGEIPETPNFEPDNSWHRLKEPGMWGLQLIATPIGLGTAGLIGYLWFALTPLDAFFPDATVLTVVWLLLMLPLIILVHELIHAAAHPKSDPAGVSVIGFWPAKVVFYAAYLGAVPRNRFLFTLLLPLLVLSILPLLIAVIFQIESSLLAYVSFVNTALAAGDLFGTMLVIYQVPRSAVICNQQHRTFFTPLNSKTNPKTK